MSILFRKKHLRSTFTLIELIIVLVIIGMLTALAVSSLRDESPASVVNRQSLALEAWCATVRYVCAEKGVDYAVRFMPEEKYLYACPVEDDAETSPAEPPDSGPMRFNLPEKMEISTVERAEDTARDTDYVEIFRFYPGGGAACSNRLVFKLEESAKYFDISFFNGQLKIHDGDGSELEVRE
ncbi:MAG: prepilin-type N-terminal cleavage/methylation domain-containing protein [Lentisphaerae bacterium]|nr:prepilin-type N-terminal cleavage/methylation domain-containing protein [Lentisphaerota bacterium]MBQ9804219.1 prepilin-type N-terminal cleavage/methylation domain-containing protein [Lentisphaeria bacterium]